MAYPLILTNAAQTIMNFMDRAFLARCSTDDVAAALPGGLLSFAFMSFFLVTTGFAATVVSQYHGKGDSAGCVRVTWAACYLSLAAGLFCALLSDVGSRIFLLFNHPASVVWREQVYFKLVLPSAGFECLNMALCAFFSGRSRTRVATVVSVVKCSANGILAYALIFGKWGCPALGIAGAGLATFMATALGPVVSGALFLMQDQRQFPTRKIRLPDMKEIWRLLQFGSRSGLQVLLDVFAWSLVLFLAGDLGKTAMAATTIALSINQISFMPLMGLSDATSILVGQNIGKGQPELSERVAHTSWKMAAWYMVPMAVVFLVLPKQLFWFFRPVDGGGIAFAEVMTYARAILACAACYNFFDAAFFVYMGALRGAGDTKGPMWIVLCCAWGILVPGSLGVVKGLKGSVLNLWVFIACYTFLVSLLMQRRFRSGAWKRIDVLGDGASPEMAPGPERGEPRMDTDGRGSF